MKILTFNTGYFLDYDGTHIDYLKRPWKSITGSEKEKSNMDEFLEIVRSENPDTVLIQEVDGGSLRSSFNGQYNYLAQRMDGFNSEFHTKYRGRLFPKIPMFRFMGNMVFFREGKVENHELHSGRKNLAQEIKMEEFSIFSLHLSTFGGWIRKRQLEEIKKIAEKREEYVLAGDLNFHKGRKEIIHLKELFKNKVISPGKTFPAKEPSQKLDLITSSKGLKVKNVKELGNRFSDHRPVTFEIEKIS